MGTSHAQEIKLLVQFRDVPDERHPEGDESQNEQPRDGRAPGGYFHFADNEFTGWQGPDGEKRRKGKIGGPKFRSDEALAYRKCQDHGHDQNSAEQVIHVLRVSPIEPDDGSDKEHQDEGDAGRKQPTRAPPFKPKLGCGR